MPRRTSQPGHTVRTSWGGRFLAALEARGPQFARPLARGRALSRGGHVVDLAYRSGGATARVLDPRGANREVRLSIEPFADDDGAVVLDGLLSSAGRAADLLGGVVPETLPEPVASRLFPGADQDVAVRCTCGDSRPLCRHGAAVLHALALALDQDALRLLEMRGVPRQQVVERLSGAGDAADSEPALKPVAEQTWEEFIGAGQPAPEMHFHLEPPDLDAMVLKQLGVPRGASPLSEWQAALTSVYRRVTAAALRMGLDQEDEPDPEGTR